jgi:hypothetical protein
VLAAKASVFAAVAFVTGLASSFAAFFLGQSIFASKGIQAQLMSIRACGDGRLRCSTHG